MIEYLVDAMGRRVGKKVNGLLTKQWLYRDTLKPVAELDGSGALVAQFVYGSKSNVPDYVQRGSTTYRVVSDHLGSPRYVVNVANSADVPFTANYAAFGSVTGTGLDWMPFGFAGGIYDPETGLVRFGARDYDPSVGRWTSKDPIRFRGGDSNLFGYVLNDPINLRDPRGTNPIDFLIRPFLEREDAAQSAENHFDEPGGGHNGPGDAYRHCLASCQLKQAYGSGYSEFWGWLNEVLSPYPNTPGEQEMDDHNNSCGRSYSDEDDCALRCLSEAHNGGLQTAP